MKNSIRALLFGMVLLLSPVLHACSFGFSVIFKPWPEGETGFVHAEPDIDAFLDGQFGKGNWTDAGDGFMASSKRSATPATVPVYVGSQDVAQAGRFRAISLFVVEQQRVLESERYTRDYLPSIYHIEAPEKNAPQAFSLDDISYLAGRIRQHSHYELGSRALPYLKTRADFSGNEQVRVLAAFLPQDPAEPVLIARQQAPTSTKPLCSWIYHVRGVWPEGLKRHYDYE